MKPLTPLVVLLASAVVLAAPVPKAQPKLEDVFGAITDPKGECKFEMSKDGSLTITVPTKHPPLDPGTGTVRPPLLGKNVEGDFVATVKVTVGVPKTAGKTGRAAKPAVFAGLTVVSADDPKTGGTIGAVVRRAGDEWAGEWLECHRYPKGSGATESGRELKPDAAVHVRLTRSGDRVVTEMSEDGTKWDPFSTFYLPGVTGPMTVGPTAFGCIDQAFTATISQFEIKPLGEEKK
jgi:hypothetical protein